MSKVKEEAKWIVDSYDDTCDLVAEEDAYIQSKRVLILAEALEKIAVVVDANGYDKLKGFVGAALNKAEEVE